jgi:DNA repair protein RadD
MTDIKLRWYQEEAPTALIQGIETSPDVHPIAVVPTGAGKTIIACELVNQYLSIHPDKDVLILSHVEEILEQNWNALNNYFGYEVGLYSAGLGSRTIKKITVAGIQSVYRKAKSFQKVGLVIVDECHLVTTRGEGMYRSFLKALPNAQYAGLTATHFRLGHGYIHEGDGALFNEKVYDLSSVENFNRLVSEGFLSKLISKATENELDVDGLKTRMGDYITDEMSKKFDTKEITSKAVEEIIRYGQNYKKWLVFAIDIEHAEHIQAEFAKQGYNLACVHSKMESDRKEIIKAMKTSNEYRGVVNVNVLTTGFDVPDIDLIAILRPTQSPVIHVQTVGRGLRVAPNKDHCLVLDFAGNTERLGPINDVLVKKPGKGKKKEGAPVKKCPVCKVYCHPKTKVCDVCGHEFKFKVKLRGHSTTAAIVKPNTIDWVDIDRVKYSRHEKPGKPTSLKVTYDCGGTYFAEWICIDHGGYPGDKARKWVARRLPEGTAAPSNLDELLEVAHLLKVPSRVFLDTTSRFPLILQSEFDDEK